MELKKPIACSEEAYAISWMSRAEPPDTSSGADALSAIASLVSG